MVRPYAWLLDRVGAEGIKLTSAGYLPPVHVEAAVAELGLAEEWYGSFNREAQTLPVLEFPGVGDAPRAGNPHEYVAGMLWRAGWARPDGTPRPLSAWPAWRPSSPSK
jgi:hypothetical protein